MCTGAIRYLLPLLSLFAVYSIFIFSYQNGFISMLQHVIADGVLPETDERLRTDITGVPALDQLLANLIPFFWPAVDGSSPSATLYGLKFSGAIGGLWSLVLLETFRTRNKSFLVLYPVIIGVLLQLFTFGVILPIYAAVHLFTSRTLPARQIIDIPSRSLTGVNLIPLSVILGYLLPSLAMVLPETTTTGFFLPSTQERIAFWQPWPIWLWLIHSTITRITALFSSPVPNSQSAKHTRSALRRVYAFAFTITAVPHIAAWSLSLTAAIFPILFDQDVATALHPARVFLNAMPWSGVQAKSFGEGALWFLQWDQVVGVGGMLLWAVDLYVAAHRARKVNVGCVGLAVKVGLLCAVSGVAGAVVELMWERDEVLLQGTGLEKEQGVETGKAKRR
ncbi:hypothetical protein EMPG_11618 [Blastomyces silverae]|uniref:Uncharacterized protein n=1 Tax=Blastomyces silverae TaxID=2060906 RepID=A0A0H1BQQ1_9EURO|nr:hypothetical protein EMPG_11618 [Blastomyces silverae]